VRWPKFTPEQAKCFASAKRAAKVDFVKGNQAHLRASCIKCHRSRANQGRPQHRKQGDTDQKGGESGRPIIPGKSAEEPIVIELWRARSGQCHAQKGKRLDAEQIGLLRAWIDQARRGTPASVSKAAAR